jgi:hypothetical protein
MAIPAVGPGGGNINTNPSSKAINAAPDDSKDPSSTGFRTKPYTPRGIASTFDSNKYTANAIKQFPDDLFNNKSQYGGNWVAFYINVVEGSKLIKNKIATTTTNDTASMRNNLDPSGRNYISTADAVIATSVAAFTTTAVATMNPFTSVQAGAVAGFLAEGVHMVTTQNQLKRIIDTIALTIPNNLTARYTMQYADESTAAQANAAAVGGAVGDVVDAVKKGLGSGNTDSAAAAVQNLGMQIVSGMVAPVALATGAAGGDFMSKVAGVATNPKKEQIFKGVDFRTFSFEYTFAPRSFSESKQVAEIIKLFKLHMHPEFNDSAGYLFMYPSEFDIVYYQGDSENLNLPRHTSCVLTDCNVNYTPNNQFTTFTDGTATQIQLSLTFRELAILTKDQILDGF